MAAVAITPDFTCPSYPLVAISGWSAVTTASAASGAVVIPVSLAALADLQQALGTNHTYVAINDGNATHHVHAWIDDGKLKCDPLPGTVYPGSCLSGSNAPRLMYCILRQTVEDGADGVDGTTVHVEQIDPEVADGNDDDSWINAVSGDIFVKVAGVWELRGNLRGASGGNGSDGQDGADGTSVEWLDGTGVPDISVGEIDDRYVDTSNGNLYKKGAGGWVLIANIKGPEGLPGNNGVSGSRWFFGTEAPTNDFGASIDFYLEIDSANWYQKSSGAWELGGSLRGIPGQDGADGAPGYSRSAFASIWGADTVFRSWPGVNSEFYPTGYTTERNDSGGTIDIDTDNDTITLSPGSYLLTAASIQVNVKLDADFIPPVGITVGTTVYLTTYIDAHDGLGFRAVANFFGFGVFPKHLDDGFQAMLAGSGMVDVPNGADVKFALHVEGLSGTTGAQTFKIASVAMPLTVVKLQ